MAGVMMAGEDAQVVVPLKEYVEAIITAHDRLYMDRFTSSEQAVKTALEATKTTASQRDVVFAQWISCIGVVLALIGIALALSGD